MLLCMRTTIDMPESLYEKLKARAAEQKTTMRDLLVEALEASFDGTRREPFRLRDASVGAPDPNRDRRIRPEAVNALLDEMREGFTR